jgi:uncharacterized protein (TIGR02246 family)
MNDDEKAIRSLIDTWLESTRTGDIDTVLQLMAEDVVFLQPGQPPMRGRDAYAAAQAGIAQFAFTGHAQIQEIRVFGDWAYCWNHLTVEFTPRNGGPGGKRAGPVLSVLHKRNGAWAIVRDANMLAPAP